MKYNKYWLFFLFPFFFEMAVAAETNNPPLMGSILSNGLPFEVVVVKTGATREAEELMNTVTNFLMTKDYDKLDGLATSLRLSKSSWANGQWKLGTLYSALVLPNEESDENWRARFVALQHWATARQESVTARVARANLLVCYAWKARGSGWADNVAEEGWRLFRQRLVQAEDILTNAQQLAQKCPMSGSVQMTIGLGLNVERNIFDGIFAKAIDTAPDYKDYYYRRAIFLLPRWNGQSGEWEKDLSNSADSIGGDKGDELYAQTVWRVGQYVSFTNIFKDNTLSWPRVDKGFEVIVKDYPTSLAAQSERAFLATEAGDRHKARKYFDQTAGLADLSVWKSKKTYLRFAKWAYLH